MSMSFHKTIVITAIGGSNLNSAYEMADDGIYDDGGGPRKRKRLTHLSPDEKILRRKLKNRVAAQTARDRKKALMHQLEEQVADLVAKNKKLETENAELRLSQVAIQKENNHLKKCLGKALTVATPEPIPSITVKSEKEGEVDNSSVLPCKTEPELPRSAASAVSLPKEQIQVLSHVMMHYAACALTLSLLCCVSWKKSMEKLETSSRKRKQMHPARRPFLSSDSPLETERTEPPWWGPQQRTWTPSMN